MWLRMDLRAPRGRSSRPALFLADERRESLTHILVVEDEARIRAFVARAFEAEGFNVDVAEDGEQGHARARAGSYELVILDPMLLGRDGLDALRDLHPRVELSPEITSRARLPIERMLAVR